MGAMNDDKQYEKHLHYGEVSSIWGFLLGAQLLLGEYQIFLNHVTDDDLRAFIKDATNDLLKSEIIRTQNLLKENGVNLPPAPSERPTINSESVPDGARFSDAGIAADIGADISAGLIACSGIMSLTAREDIATMFGEIHMKKAQQALKMLRLMKKKSWLVVPPLHKPELVGAAT